VNGLELGQVVIGKVPEKIDSRVSEAVILMGRDYFWSHPIDDNYGLYVVFNRFFQVNIILHNW